MIKRKAMKIRKRRLFLIRCVGEVNYVHPEGKFINFLALYLPKRREHVE